MKKILITGGSGLIGTILNNHLNANYDVQNLDRNKPKNKEKRRNRTKTNTRVEAHVAGRTNSHNSKQYELQPHKTNNDTQNNLTYMQSEGA